MKTRLFILSITWILLCSACQSTARTPEKPQPSGESPPEEFTLFQPVPVLAVRFIATTDGYEIFQYRTVGVPSLDIDQNRDVVIRVYDAEGDVLGVVTVHNPREVHTAGASKPDSAVIPEVTFTLFFENPLAIRMLEVTVLRGPNADYKESFRIDPQGLKIIVPFP